jgi:hypothetical protein
MQNCAVSHEDPLQARPELPAGAADWLSLAAAPTFAVMALLTVLLGSDASGMLCLPTQHAAPLTGMAPMYVLMSAFHAAPWLRLIGRRRHSR